ncbi:hypothetical protein K438DRAFT_1991085 [Mycena galopus ATCC 62051]|nr:hypothetical protein K438DRAFT_1991085 [Mycena galopus ATCC 62051]
MSHPTVAVAKLVISRGGSRSTEAPETTGRERRLCDLEHQCCCVPGGACAAGSPAFDGPGGSGRARSSSSARRHSSTPSKGSRPRRKPPTPREDDAGQALSAARADAVECLPDAAEGADAKGEYAATAPAVTEHTKKMGQGHAWEAQQWESDTSASEDEKEKENAPSSAELTNSNSKPPPLGRAQVRRGARAPGGTTGCVELGRVRDGRTTERECECGECDHDECCQICGGDV